MKEQVLIAGAGVVGASIAYHLARRGVRDILVIDRASGFGAGSTAKATGGFRAQFDSEVNVRLSLLARERLRAFEEETGVDSGYRTHGYLFLACSEEELDALRRAQAVQHACGLAEARMVTPDEAREINPAIGDATIAGGAFCPTDGFIRAMNILRGYADAAQRMGVRFEFNRPLESWQDVDAPIRIDARGAWSGTPVTPVRRNVAATVPTRILDESMPMTIWSGDWYHLRVRDGRVLLLLSEEREHWLAEIRRRTWRRVPCLRDIEIEECWWGWYEMSPDEHALLGMSDDGVYLATGSSGHGVMHAPALGQLLAEMIVDGKTSIDVSALRPDRFS